MIRKISTPRIRINDSGCLPYLKYSDFNQIDCNYSEVCYNELFNKYIYKSHVDNIKSYIFSVDDVDYIIDFNNFTMINNISTLHQTHFNNIIAKNLSYRNKKVDCVTIKFIRAIQ